MSTNSVVFFNPRNIYGGRKSPKTKSFKRLLAVPVNLSSIEVDNRNVYTKARFIQSINYVHKNTSLIEEQPKTLEKNTEEILSDLDSQSQSSEEFNDCSDEDAKSDPLNTGFFEDLDDVNDASLIYCGGCFSTPCVRSGDNLWDSRFTCVGGTSSI